MASHTAGPWHTDYSPSTGFGSGYGRSQIISADGRAIAGVALVAPNEGELYRNGSFSQEAFDTLEANASLIAAAPDLIESWELLIENIPAGLFSDYGYLEEYFDKGKAALGKAQPQDGR